jgi:isopenicillin N synthase-like dioxygenase
MKSGFLQTNLISKIPYSLFIRLSGKGRGDVKESFYLADPSSASTTMDEQKLPAILEHQRDVLSAFYQNCSSISQHLLEAFAIGMNVSPSCPWHISVLTYFQLKRDYLSQYHNGSASRMRLIHYPAVPFSETLNNLSTSSPGHNESVLPSQPLDVRAGAHSDYGSLTLLFQQETDKGGLQVLLPRTNTWLDIPVLANAIIVNIGDALEFWTAGRLRSTVHRVVFPRTEGEAIGRYSIPFFVQPDADVLLVPIEGEGQWEEVAREKGYKDKMPVTAGEHLRRRIMATYERSKG